MGVNREKKAQGNLQNRGEGWGGPPSKAGDSRTAVSSGWASDGQKDLCPYGDTLFLAVLFSSSFLYLLSQRHDQNIPW
jgi:hypothetical protein